MAARHGKAAAGWFEGDVRQGRLPQVSWLVAPTAQSEHPDYFPAAGAEYIASKLDAIAADEDLWRTTVFIVTYDENDGLFDHVPPPVAPRGTAGEYVGGEPIGLGFRVPAIVVSPWSAGGWVCSDVLDHTSLIRIIEKRFGVPEPNISAYRRRLCGDFTTALRFSGQPAAYPRSPGPITLAAAEAGLLTAQREVFVNPAPGSRRPTSRSRSSEDHKAERPEVRADVPARRRRAPSDLIREARAPPACSQAGGDQRLSPPPR